MIVGIVAIILLVVSSVLVVGETGECYDECCEPEYFRCISVHPIYPPTSVSARCFNKFCDSECFVECRDGDEPNIINNYYSSTSGGLSMNKVVNYLETTFMDFLNSVFATHSDIEEVHSRIDIIEAKVNLLVTNQEITTDSLGMMTAMVESERTGEEIILENNVRCRADKCIVVTAVN